MYDINNWLRHDGASASNQYYGYNLNPNASDSDTNWSIRQVQTINSIDYVKWSNNSIYQWASTWANRTQSFSTPSGSLGLTYSVSGSEGTYFVTMKWNLLTGVDQYIISTLNTNGTPISPTGDKIIGPYVTSTYSCSFFNNNNYTQKVVDTNATYSITLIGINQAGTISTSVNIHFA